jgi:hypothetical protein
MWLMKKRKMENFLYLFFCFAFHEIAIIKKKKSIPNNEMGKKRKKKMIEGMKQGAMISLVFLLMHIFHQSIIQ